MQRPSVCRREAEERSGRGFRSWISSAPQPHGSSAVVLASLPDRIHIIYDWPEFRDPPQTSGDCTEDCAGNAALCFMRKPSYLRALLQMEPRVHVHDFAEW